MILQIADDIAMDRIELELSQDETASIPFALFSVEEILHSAFEQFVTRDDTPPRT
jgi:hypothetical protein